MDALTSTRRLLHGVAEGLLAGPQHRSCGRIALRVVPGGFATVGRPALRLDGTDLVIDEGRRVPLNGTLGDVGAATGHGYGEPVDVYHQHSGTSADDSLELDADARGVIVDWYVLGDAALRALAPNEVPTLWPEHFDVAILLQDRSFGVSAGDDYSPQPYAYVSDNVLPRDDFWNAPFGACRPAEQLSGVADLVAFWSAGLDRISST
ncbi:MAG: hypothetical protein ACJ71T_05505 [Actinomycetales bacterium]